jgi:hypothetical protein
MAKFKSKRGESTVEAIQFTPESTVDACAFVADCGGLMCQSSEPDYIVTRTTEGDSRANHGDWLVKIADGEIYACAPVDFADTWEPVGPAGGPVGAAE